MPKYTCPACECVFDEHGTIEPPPPPLPTAWKAVINSQGQILSCTPLWDYPVKDESESWEILAHPNRIIYRVVDAGTHDEACAKVLKEYREIYA